jgi:hypothetical protein
VLTREYLDVRPGGWLDYAPLRIAQLYGFQNLTSPVCVSIVLSVSILSWKKCSYEFSSCRGAKKCYNKTLCEEQLNILLPAKPPFHPRQFRTCAVVGNSGDLLKTEFGKEIDGHDAVFRDNEAPVNEVNLSNINFKIIYCSKT